MGRNKTISLVAGVVMIIGLFLPFVDLGLGALGKASLFDGLKAGGDTQTYIFTALTAFFAVLTAINQPLGARIIAIIILLWMLFILFAAGFTVSIFGVGAWLILLGSLLGTLFSKADA